VKIHPRSRAIRLRRAYRARCPFQRFPSTLTSCRRITENSSKQFVALSPGIADAVRYVDAIERFFTAALYPTLRCPRKEVPINDGRKRIDLSYTNDATDGCFGWLQRNHASGNIFFECKNYSHEVANPELDQLAGRFSPTRGRVAFLVRRSVEDKGRLYGRCRDLAIGKQEFIIPLEDADLIEFVDALQNGNDSVFAFFKTRFDKVSM